jgi:hypothetical protein
MTSMFLWTNQRVHQLRVTLNDTMVWQVCRIFQNNFGSRGVGRSIGSTPGVVVCCSAPGVSCHWESRLGVNILEVLFWLHLAVSQVISLEDVQALWVSDSLLMLMLASLQWFPWSLLIFCDFLFGTEALAMFFLFSLDLTPETVARYLHVANVVPEQWWILGLVSGSEVPEMRNGRRICWRSAGVWNWWLGMPSDFAARVMWLPSWLICNGLETNPPNCCQFCKAMSKYRQHNLQGNGSQN